MRGKDAIVLTVCGLAAATGAGVWVMSGGEKAPSSDLVVAMATPEPEVVERQVVQPRVRPTREPAPAVEATPEARPPAREGRPEGERGERGGFDREEMMKRFDKDGDGELNEEERQALREELGNRRGRGDDQMRQLIMRRYDADGDGELSDAEREVARADFTQMREQIQAKIVPQYDLDGDGELNDEEREAARPAFRAEFERIRAFAVLDEDGSGDVNPIELAKALSAVGEGSELMDLNRDGTIDYRDATYATELATDGN
ncbi:MAG: hypothetical protein ACF8R9_09700 [Phycisphaerales bacterium JB054]